MSHHRTSQEMICLVLSVLFLSACGAAVAPLTPVPPTATPAGRCRIVYEANGDIYARNCDGSNVRRLTDHPAQDRSPAWSPDGQRILFDSQRDRQRRPDGVMPVSVYVVSADGSNLTCLACGDSDDQYPVWSPDSSRIAFHRDCDLMTMHPDGSNLTLVLPQSAQVCVDNPAWSPNGQRLAFVSWRPAPSPDQPSRDIYVVNSNGTGLLKLAHFESERVIAAWSPDGNQIGIEVQEERAGRHYLITADGSSGPVETPSIPDSWFSWHWPQWSEK